MILQNPFYSYIYQYTKEVNKEIDENYLIDNKYQSIKKEKDNIITFKFFNIEKIQK